MSLPARVAAAACQTPSPRGWPQAAPVDSPQDRGRRHVTRRAIHTPRPDRSVVPRSAGRGPVGSRAPDRGAMEPLVLVVPASGGLGASTFAAVLARQVSGVLVDGDVEGAGVDATLVLEEEPGLRWPDLAGLEGPAEPRHLLARLPGSAPPVLAGAGPTRVRSAVVSSALAALRAQRPVVVDLPAPVLDRHDWLAWADLVVLLVGLRPRQVRDAEVTLRRVRDGAATVRLVTRGARRAEPVGREVADHLGGAWLGHLEDEPGVLRDEGRGRPPRSRGAVGRVARSVADVLPPATADEGGEPRWLRAAG